MHHNVYQEGWHAGLLAFPRDLNPYAKAVQAITNPSSVSIEYASDWESGWQVGNRQLSTQQPPW